MIQHHYATYDTTVNAIYVYKRKFDKEKRGIAKKTIEVPAVVLKDIDKNGKTLGFEILLGKR